MPKFADDEINKELEARARVDALKPYLPGISALITEELVEATRNNGGFTCAHHGISVLREEFEELWDEIKKKGNLRDPNTMKKEAIQVAAMAIRFIIDVVETKDYRA